MPLSAASFRRSQYLNGTSLQPGQREIAEIIGAEGVTFEGDDFETLVIHVATPTLGERSIAMNATRREICATAFGDDALLWPGEKIILTRGRGSFKGKACATLDVEPILSNGRHLANEVPTPPPPPENGDPGASEASEPGYSDRFEPESYADDGDDTEETYR
jgi:hypothetical protein